jgi:hypothetical protein
MNTLLQYKQLTFEEINVLWKESCLGDGTPLPLRTFHQHKNAVEEMFGVEIKCNASNGYRYYISTPETLKNNTTRKWLLNSFTLSNMITAGHNMKERILFEEIPSGTEYLQTVIEAMQKSKELIVDYQRFYGRRETFNICPYAMKVYRQRWYVVGCIKELGGIRNIALDRTLEMNLSDISFTLPLNFNAEKYYAHSVGIYVDEELKPTKVKIRAYGNQIEYLRSLPLHRSQKEGASKYGEFCEFEYKLCLSPELSTHILAMGENVEVLEPVELREEIKRKLTECLTKYK